MSRTHLSLSIAFLVACSLQPSLAAFAQDSRPAELQHPAAWGIDAQVAKDKANGFIATAKKLGKLRAAGELRREEAAYRATLVETGRQNLKDQRDLCEIRRETTNFWKQERQKRIAIYVRSALTRVEDVRQGNWPQALRGEEYRSMRVHLAACVRFDSRLAAHGGFNPEGAAVVATKMREQLRGQVCKLVDNQQTYEYEEAMRFLDELKHLRMHHEVAQSL